MTDKITSIFTPMRPSNPAPPRPQPVKGPAAQTKPPPAPPPPKPTASYDIAVTVAVASELPHGEPIQVRSVLGRSDERGIVIQINAGHALVGRALQRADTLLIKFLLCLALSEYVGYWSKMPDGRALGSALLRLAGVNGDRCWGITLAHRIASTALLGQLDTLPLFGPAPQPGPFELFRLQNVRLREVSDLPNWRPKQLTGSSARKEEACD